MFDGPVDRAVADVRARSIEQRLDILAESAKEATQLAGKIRTALNALAENAQTGNVSAAPGQLARLAETLTGLNGVIDRLNAAERSTGVRGEGADPAAYARELQAELAKKGVAVTKGPEPYWLAYPAWIKVERSSKGLIEVVMNGDKLDSVRPTAVANTVAHAVNDKFNAKQFAELLDSVRQVLRRAGATDSTLRLEDLYAVLALEPGKSAARRKEFTRGDFYYSVHRLSEESGRVSGSSMSFPSSDRSDIVFFDRGGESRRYLTVQFGAGELR